MCVENVASNIATEIVYTISASRVRRSNPKSPVEARRAMILERDTYLADKSLGLLGSGTCRATSLNAGSAARGEGRAENCGCHRES